MCLSVSFGSAMFGAETTLVNYIGSFGRLLNLVRSRLLNIVVLHFFLSVSKA